MAKGCYLALYLEMDNRIRYAIHIDKTELNDVNFIKSYNFYVQSYCKLLKVSL